MGLSTRGFVENSPIVTGVEPWPHARCGTHPLTQPGLSHQVAVNHSGGYAISNVGEGRREVEEETVAGKNGVNVLVFGLLFITLACLVQKHIPAPVVVVAAKVYDLLFLPIAQGIRAVIEDGGLLFPREE